MMGLYYVLGGGLVGVALYYNIIKFKKEFEKAKPKIEDYFSSIDKWKMAFIFGVDFGYTQHRNGATIEQAHIEANKQLDSIGGNK